MAQIKAYTDISQSKKLAEILPLESADMYWWSSGKRYYIEAIDDGDFNEEEGHIRAWSLAALLGVLPPIEGFCPIIDLDINLIRYEGNYRDELCFNGDNLIDACVAMVVKLNELKML